MLQTPFAFWQEGGDCAGIPGPNASTAALYSWYDNTVGWLLLDDQQSDPYFAYNYQAGAELGWPIIHEPALQPWLHFTSAAQRPQEDLPPSIPRPTLDQDLMRAVHDWVASHGKHLLFLYGEQDPWRAQPFVLGSGSVDSAIYVVPGGDHTSSYLLLPTAERNQFISRIQRWAGVTSRSATGQSSASNPFSLVRRGSVPI